MISQELLRKINGGRCFIFVGSGPSCDAGYPSWQTLAENTIKALIKDGYVTDKSAYDDYLVRRKFPELFRQAERDVGDREKLCEIVKALLEPCSPRKGQIYDIICRWPFACYLTTNFDDELVARLPRYGEHFELLRNQMQHFHSVRDGSSHLILKLHSDLDHYNEVVLTSNDYQKYYVRDSGEYYRVKLRQIFEMFDILIIGHSLSDPDIDYVLQIARQTASPLHRIHMISDGFNSADETELIEKYNIQLVRYSDEDGSHRQLHRILAAADRFIPPRGRNRFYSGQISIPQEEADAACALYIYSTLRSTNCNDNLGPLILVALASIANKNTTVEDIKLQTHLAHIVASSGYMNSEIDKSLQILVDAGLAHVDELARVSITTAGRESVEQWKAISTVEDNQAFGQFELELRSSYPELTDSEAKLCRSLASAAIVNTFRSRGLAIANSVFAGQTASPEALSDIFGEVSKAATELASLELRAAFIEGMHDFIVSPHASQKSYLASISQGYFLFHMLGLDPSCTRLRRDVFQNTVWLCDSSILLPYIAPGCHNHDYAAQLFQTLNEQNAVLYTTRKLLLEAWEHLQWAKRFQEQYSITSGEFMQAALVKGSYKQNLFIDGYIRLSATGSVGSFADYLARLLPSGVSQESFENLIASSGVEVLHLPHIEGFLDEDWTEVDRVRDELEQQRKLKGTYRSQLQVESESEIWVIVKNLRASRYILPKKDLSLESVYFISQSRILDAIDDFGGVTTWSPEAVYRYISALPGKNTDPELLQQCMLNEYYYARVSFIDESLYLRFFGPSIDKAKLSFKEQKAKYINDIEQEYATQLESEFEKTPDLEKPIFVAQMAWKLADVAKQREVHAMKRAEEAESRVRQLEAERDSAWKLKSKRRDEQEAARLRNMQDPKHMRKRQKQAKKRKKKK